VEPRKLYEKTKNTSKLNEIIETTSYLYEIGGNITCNETIETTSNISETIETTI
jgi:hypothetical protein